MMFAELKINLKNIKWLFIVGVLTLLATKIKAGEVIYAVNCGGGSHVDSFGIRYQKDPLSVGVSSDHGKILSIRRVPLMDQILYQTERYHVQNFEYNIPVKEDGDYVLVLKFSEVWFSEPNKKVFNVKLNQEHTIVQDLDIFSLVGLGAAHDEIIPFSVRNNILSIKSEKSKFNGVLSVEFVKTHLDNPKINAIYVLRGTEEEVPRLPPLKKFVNPMDEEEEDDDYEETPERRERSGGREGSATNKHRRSASELHVSDPYANEDGSSLWLPFIVAIAAFLPVVFCLCRL